MKEIWYWEYVITFWDEDKAAEVERAGVVTGETITEAVAALDGYYDIMNIKTLKAIMDTVFEFDEANEDSTFDYTIKRKG